MKKIICAFLLIFTSTLTIISCTEEEVAPTHEETDNGGGAGQTGEIGGKP